MDLIITPVSWCGGEEGRPGRVSRRTLGLDVPLSLQPRADEVIERWRVCCMSSELARSSRALPQLG
jgi:hypothetical protein